MHHLLTTKQTCTVYAPSSFLYEKRREHFLTADKIDNSLMADLMGRNQMYEDLHSPQGLSYYSLKESRRITSWAMYSSIKILKQRQKERLPISPDQKIP